MRLMTAALMALLTMAAHAEVDMQRCVLLMQFEDDPGLLADSTTAQPLATAEGAVSPTPGRFGGGCALGAGGGWLNAGTNFGLSYCFPEQTIALWLRPDPVGLAPGETRFIIGTRAAPERSSWRWNLIIDEQGRLAFQLYDGALEDKVVLLTAPEPLPTDRWTHVAVVVDTVGEDRARLYVDGVPIAEAEVRTNLLFGSLYLGGAAPQGYAGALDEVAIFEGALTAEEIAELAAADGPLQPAALAAEDLPEGFRLRPVAGMHYVVITHSALPETRWMLRIPEHTYAVGDLRAITTDVRWRRGEEPQSWRFTWEADEAEKLEAGLDFEGRVVARGDVIEYALTARNVGDAPWEPGRLGLFCFKAPDSPDFVDLEAERTWVRRGGQWVTMGEVVGHQFAEHRMCGIGVGEAADQAEPIAAKFTQDGRYLAAIATHPAGSLSFNFMPTANCLHSNPAWGKLQPGDEQTVTRRIYLIAGTLDDLYARYRHDFGLR